MRKNKYTYLKVIQQYCGGPWNDVSEYECDSMGNTFEMSGKFITLKSGRQRELKLITHDLKEYQLTGYPTRVIFRKELNTEPV
jgi:hypothetical protein